MCMILMFCDQTQEENDEKVEDDDDDEDEMIYDEDFDAEDEAEEEDGDGGGLEEEEEEEEEVQESTKMKILRRVAGVANKLKEIIGNLITTAGQVVVTILLGLTGVTLPSLSSAVYFFVFLGLCTWWSLCKTFDKLLFSCLCVLMAIFSAGHLIILYSNQFQFLIKMILLLLFLHSVFGISSIVRTDCSSTWKLAVNSGLNWHHFVNPIMLLVLYYTLATLIRLWLQDPMIMVSLMSLEDCTNILKCIIYYLNVHTAWSITYVSWLTFVFLLWSCTLWMVRDRRKYAMMTSPFMVAYGNLLLVLQYIWCFERLDPVPGFFLKMEVPFTELSTKVLCQLSFWLLLRQTLMERQEKMEEEAALCDVQIDEQKKGGNDLMHVIGKLVMALLVKYWIYVCGGMFFFVSFEGKMVMYKIIYMMMFLSCVALYQVHYEWWRRILKYFWMSVVMYTMLVLILIYTCQFENAIATWTRMTGIKEEGLKAMGLEKYVLSDLFTRIFIPTSFLLVCILHLHYFHDRFLQLTDLKAVISKEQSTIYRHIYTVCVCVCVCVYIYNSCFIHILSLIQSVCVSFGHNIYTEENKLISSRSDLKNKWHLVVDRLTVLFLKFLEYFHKLKLFIWWLLEMHIIKIVSTYIILLSVKEVSLLNYVFLISWAFALPYQQFRVLASSVCTIWTCVVIVCKLLYQLETIEPVNYSSNCTMPSNYTEEQKIDMKNSLLYRKPVDPANWVGLEKFVDILPNLRNNLLMLAILAFEVTIYRHQEFFRLRNKLSPPPSRTIFHDITRQHLDNSIINCIKYFINYFFYKFGLEVCFLLAINVMGQRMDFYSMLHGLALAVVMYRRRRKAIAEIWPKYCCFLACMITFQYFICIGIPPAACKDYPWRFPGSMMDSDVIKWLYLPDFHTQPSSMFLVYDFMLLLCASLQRQVFEDENKAAVRLMAGDNVEICRDLDAASFSVHNPVPDFIHCRSYLDMLKVIMFSYLFWFVLTIIFITGTTRISIFCMGYLVACFYFLLFGGDLLLKPIKKILRYWDFLIAYNVFVITMKNVFAILACGYIKHLVNNSCWLVQLLSLACTIKEYKALEGKERLLLVPRDEAGIIWDSICFTFLLLQRRVFMSYYFLHVVADIRAGQILASRYLHIRLHTSVLDLFYMYVLRKKELPSEFRGRQNGWTRCVHGAHSFPVHINFRQTKLTFPLPVDNIIKRVFNIIKFTWVLFLTTVESVTKWLNSVCREYIDISTVLRIERCMLTREVKKVLLIIYTNIFLNLMMANDCKKENLKLIQLLSSIICELENSEHFYKSQPLGLQLCYALYNLLVAHSEMVCYLVIILNHMISASMATLVLPILIFLWAMLSVPRPSKRFWMTAIVYTEVSVTIFIKYFFQFSFFPFNQNLKVNEEKPYHPPNIIGTEKKEGYVHYDLVQLLALFFHRSILKVLYILSFDDSVDEGKMAVAIPPEEEKKGSPAYSLKSVNLGMSVDSSQVHVQILYPEHRPHLRRQSTSGSHLSRRSSVRSKRACLLFILCLSSLLRLVKFYQPIRQFFYNLIHPEYNAVTDVYVLMFLADTVDFIIIVFGFWAFGKHQAGADITSSLSEDQVPGPFLVMVLIQFGTMVVDRALYLRKTVMGKVIFQVVLVFGIHFWMFFILPGITNRRFSHNTIAQLWYFVKCIYFGLSAYQIRCGYPTRILGNFLTKSYNYVNLFLFQGFRMIPFLTELRAVMDWVWTDTTLSLSSWICVEDIYAHIFILKCWRESEKRYPQPRGQKKKKVVKYGMGGMIVMLLICIVWFPLLFMSLIKSVAGVVNTPLDVSVTLTLGGLQPIFTMSAQQNHLKTVTSAECLCLLQNAMQFLESYIHEDLTIAQLEGSSNSLWTISPPSKENLIKMLSETNETFPLTFTWSIQRNLSLGAKAETAIGKHYIDLDEITRTNLTNLLNGTEQKEVTIKNIFPRYIRAPSDSNLSTCLFLFTLLDASECGLELYIISDQVSPPSLGFLAGYGIMGLYMSVVLVIGKFVREFFSGISHTIMFEELPNVDRILKLCTDIFLVRETGELDLEEDLYAKLIFLYRSPETMIKWTREKSE
uniref:Piezo type mechanosensitive ion channel component 2 n=1 Tax=Cyprinus carpio TaxID=7962 RepID=A0A8C2FTR0_CYPCA